MHHRVRETARRLVSPSHSAAAVKAFVPSRGGFSWRMHASNQTQSKPARRFPDKPAARQALMDRSLARARNTAGHRPSAARDAGRVAPVRDTTSDRNPTAAFRRQSPANAEHYESQTTPLFAARPP